MTQKKNLWVRAAVCASLIVMVVIVFTVGVSAETASSGQWTYRVENGGAVITGYVQEPEGDVILPDELDGHPVTGIGERAFYGCSDITSVVIPDSVASIGAAAFGECLSLSSVNIPEALTSIEPLTFQFCYSLDNITIPDGVTSIGDRAFFVTSLGGVIIPSSVTSMGEEAFMTGVFVEGEEYDMGWSSTALIVREGGYAHQYVMDSYMMIPYYIIEYVLEDGGAKIIQSEKTPYWNDPLQGNLSIPAELDGYPVTGIGENAFEGFNRLTSVAIPESVTSIGAGVFEGCYGLTITIPSSVTSIDPEAFSGVGYTLICEEGSYAEQYVKENDISILQTDESGQWRYVFTDNGVKVILYGERGRAAAGEKTIPGELDGYPVTGIGEYIFRDSWLTNVTIPEGVTTIGRYAFQSSDSLTSVTLPATVQVIDWGAFQGCQELTDFVLSEGVAVINNEAFLACEGLTDFVIPQSVEYIGDRAFEMCDNITLIVTEGSAAEQYFKDIGIPYAIEGTDGARQVVSNIMNIDGWECVPMGDGVMLVRYDGELNGDYEIPRELGGYLVTGMDKRACWNSNRLTRVTIPGSITSIGMSAFLACENLTRVTIEEGVTIIGHQAFEGCVALTDMTIPETVTEIGYIAFCGCSSLTNLTIPAGVTTIQEEAFMGCDNLILAVTEGSYAEQYAKDNGIAFEYIQ